MRLVVTETDSVVDAAVYFGVEVRSHNEPADTFRVFSGGARYVIDVDGAEYTSSHGHTVRPPSHRPYRVTVPPGAFTTTVFPGVLVRDVARRAFVDEPVRLDLDAMYPVSPELERLWLEQMGNYRRHVLQPEVHDHRLISETATRALVTTAIVTFGLHRPVDVRAQPSLAARRARTFIDANLQRAITIHDIATASRLSVRGLQYTFGHAYGQSPTTYLRTARLSAAHDDLVVSDPSTGASVADIARRWGFMHLGRFASAYRSVYGVTPRETLFR